MSISAINSVSFKGNTQPAQTTQTVQQERKTGGIGPAIASLVIPGLGQFINGDKSNGFKFLGGYIAIQGLGGFMALKGKIKPAIAANITSLALAIVSVINAYRGNEPELIEQTENKVDTKA